MSNVDQEFQEWLAKNYPQADPVFREDLRRAFEYAYFAGWSEGERQANNY